MSGVSLGGLISRTSGFFLAEKDWERLVSFLVKKKIFSWNFGFVSREINSWLPRENSARSLLIIINEPR